MFTDEDKKTGDGKIELLVDIGKGIVNIHIYPTKKILWLYNVYMDMF